MEKSFKGKIWGKIKRKSRKLIRKNQAKSVGKTLGSLSQKAIWKPKICGGIFGQIHPQNRHQQPENQEN